MKHGKSRPGSIKTAELLPLDYAAGKDIEQSILAAHSKLKDMTEADGKAFYIQFCRSLRTYGATYFLVNEKRKAKKKMVPTLLGFKPTGIIRVDKVSKQVIVSWPLNSVHRWLATDEFFKLVR